MAYKNIKKVLKKRRLRREQKNLFQGESLEPRHAFDGSDALDAALVISPNQAPVNNLPAEQTTFVNQPLAFIRDYVTNTPGNRISITDADAGLNPLRVTISVDSGTMSSVFPDPRGGLTYLEGDGTDDAEMVFEGTLQDIDSFFHWFSYQPAEGFVGDATLTIETNDLGSGSIQRQLVDADSLRISVMPVPEYAPSPDYDTFPGMPDPTFHGNGRHLRSISNGVDYIKDMVVLEDGKVLAVGAIDGRAAVMRFKPGMHHLDESFGNSNGYTVLNDSPMGREFSSMEIDDLGRIIAAGDRFVARFTPDGHFDLSFGVNGTTYFNKLGAKDNFRGQSYEIGLRKDGQIMVFCPDEIIHLNQNGEVVFSSDGAFGNETAIVLHADESVTMFSNNKWERNSKSLYVTKANGGYGGQTSQQYQFGEKQFFYSSVVLRDGSVRLIGELDDDVAVVAFKPDGTPDSSFGSDGVAVVPVLSANDAGYRAKVAPDGKIVIVGRADNGVNKDFVIVRLNKDGSVDESFNNSGKFVTNWGGDDQAYAVEILPNGKILAAGKTGDSIGLVQLLGDSRVGVPVSTVYLSDTSIVENGTPGSVIGSLTTDSATDNSETTYALVSGPGDIDNDAFTIVGSELQSAASFDYETKSSYTVRVRATTVDGHVVEQAFSIAIENANDLPTGSVELSGIPTAGETLVAENSIFDQDGVGTLEYQWSRDGVAIEGATAETYTLSAADVGAVIAVRVNYTDAQGTAETVTSEGTLPVATANQAPFGLNLSAAIIAENKIAGSVVGELSASDPDADDVLTYSLVNGEGDTENDSFEIVGSELRATESFDFEIQNQYSIRVRATDSAGLLTEKTLSIGISNVNEAPFGLSLSSLLVLENASAGTVVGEFEASDPDADDVLTYSLVAGEGDTDNAFFEIVSAELRATESFDFESQNSYSVRVRAVDAAGLATDKTFIIAVVNANDAPVGSVIINGIAEEGKKLRATNDLADQDGLGTISYQWKRNGAEIEGAVADAYMLSQADVGSVITVTASYTDRQGTYEEIDSNPTSLVIAANKAPSELDLSSTQIQENKVPGTVVGELSTVDPDADDALTYSLVAGDGDVDNNSFEIHDAELRATQTFDYETKSSYSVRVRVTDSGGLYFEKVFSIEVTDVDDTVATETTFDYLILEAQQAGSTVDIDDIRVTDLGSNTVVFENDFETDDLTGVELYHSEDSGYEYSENLEMTRIQDGRLRLETTGFLQNGAGGYNSRSRMVIPNQLPDEFEITFTARKLQWAGHFKVILGNSESDYADISTQNGNEFGVHDGDYGFYVHQAGGVAPTPAGVLINLDGEVVELPTQTTLTNLHNTDAKYRIVRQAKELSLYINDNLIATKNDLLDPNSAVEDSIDVDVPLVIAAEEGVISLDAEITYDPNVVQFHDIAADANLPEGTIAMLTEIAPGRSYLGIMTTPALNDASYVLGSLSATITGSSETLASLVTFENVQLNEGAVSAYDADGNIVIRLGNSAPTGISLSGTEVSENSPLYTAVGSFETTDIDTTDQFTYQLVAGDGAVDNSDFVIDGNVLRTLSPLDYETQSSYSVRVRSTDTIGQSVEQVFTITVGDVIESLAVTGLTSNQSGFTVSFNEAVSEDQLNLYDGFGTYGTADVTLTGAVSGAVTGSAVLSDDGMSLVFVSSTPLVNDSYTVVLNSGEKAFIGVDGRLLDGNSDGTAGDNYTQSFIVDDAVSTVVSTPSFARAPGESVDLGTGTQRGLPVQLDSDGSVQSVAFTVEFDPAVISVDSVEKGVTLPVDALITYDMVQPGVISIAITTSEMISAGAATVAVINASVIENVDYASSSIVTIKDVVLNSGQVAGAGSSAVHVASRLGDTSGDGNYSGFDAVLAARLAAFKDTGLAAYPMVDPVVVADVSGNGDIRMYDSGLVASVPSDGSSVGPRNNASGNTKNVIFRQNGQFGSATVAPSVAGTNERVRAFLEYAKAAKIQNFANTASAAASGSVGASQSGGGETMAKRSKLLFAPLPVAK